MGKNRRAIEKMAATMSFMRDDSDSSKKTLCELMLPQDRDADMDEEVIPVHYLPNDDRNHHLVLYRIALRVQKRTLVNDASGMATSTRPDQFSRRIVASPVSNAPISTAQPTGRRNGSDAVQSIDLYLAPEYFSTLNKHYVHTSRRRRTPIVYIRIDASDPHKFARDQTPEVLWCSVSHLP